LLLATGQLRWPMVLAMSKPDLGQGSGCLDLGLASMDASNFGSDGCVLQCRQVRQKVKRLEDKADPVAPKIAPGRRIQLVHAHVVDHDGTRRHWY